MIVSDLNQKEVKYAAIYLKSLLSGDSNEQWLNQ